MPAADCFTLGVLTSARTQGITTATTNFHHSLFRRRAQYFAARRCAGCTTIRQSSPPHSYRRTAARREAVGSCAAKSPGPFAAGWRPRPSGRRHIIRRPARVTGQRVPPRNHCGQRHVLNRHPRIISDLARNRLLTTGHADAALFEGPYGSPQSLCRSDRTWSHYPDIQHGRARGWHRNHRQRLRQPSNKLPR